MSKGINQTNLSIKGLGYISALQQCLIDLSESVYQNKLIAPKFIFRGETKVYPVYFDSEKGSLNNLKEHEINIDGLNLKDLRQYRHLYYDIQNQISRELGYISIDDSEILLDILSRNHDREALNTISFGDGITGNILKYMICTSF